MLVGCWSYSPCWFFVGAIVHVGWLLELIMLVGCWSYSPCWLVVGAILHVGWLLELFSMLVGCCNFSAYCL